LTISGTAGDCTLSFSATGLTGVTSTAITVTAGAATKLTLTTQPSAAAQSGVAFAQQPVVQLRDASGNPVNQAGVVVTAAIATGSGTLGGTLTATTLEIGRASCRERVKSAGAGETSKRYSGTGLASARFGPIALG